MGELTVIPPGGGDVVGDSPERRVEIVSDHDSLNATWSRFGPGREGAELHVHRRHTDLFYVLDGELTLRLGVEGAGVVVRAGTLARVPPLVVHGFRNGSDADVRYLNLHAPGREFATYMRALRDGRKFSYDQHAPPADGGRPPSETVIGRAEALGGGVALLADVEEIAIGETTGARGGPAHVHRRHVESLYVLQGELALTAGDGELRASAGSWLQIPPGIPHALSGTGRFLDVHTPSCGFGGFLRALRDAGDEEAAATQAAFDQQPVP